jgi:hypothetical protein
MAEHNLSTAKYFERAEEASQAGDSGNPDDAARKSAATVDAWARASRWISAVAGVAVVGCTMAIAIPYFTAASSGKPTSPFDWFLRFGGARSDQTFEKWVRDSTQANQRQWEEMYRNSPAYQFDPSKPIDWHFEPPKGFVK